jgi:hypothetical protein
MTDTIGFYALLSTTDNKGFVGALLITDDLGKPEEFRVTYPVKPTALQRQLYGDSLIPHIGVELCGKPLYQALKNKPSILLVNDKRFLALTQSVPCPVAHMERLGDALKLTTSEAGFEKQDHKLQSSSGRFQPLAITYPQEYTEVQQVHAAQVLQRLFAGVDLIEPFDRISLAFKALVEQDEKFR